MNVLAKKADKYETFELTGERALFTKNTPLLWEQDLFLLPLYNAKYKKDFVSLKLNFLNTFSRAFCQSLSSIFILQVVLCSNYWLFFLLFIEMRSVRISFADQEDTCTFLVVFHYSVSDILSINEVQAQIWAGLIVKGLSHETDLSFVAVYGQIQALKVHRREKFFVSDFEFFTILQLVKLKY